MKQKLKTSKLLLIISLGGLLFNSCQKESDDNYNKSGNSSLIKEFTFKQAIQKPEFNNAYHKFADGLNIMKAANKSEEPDFVIDSTIVKEITLGKETTYTMAIKRPTPSNGYFENLIVKVASDSTKAYIIKYTPSQKMGYFEEHNSFDFHGTMQIKEIVFDSSSFHSKGSTVCYTVMTCDVGPYVHIRGAECTGNIGSETYCQDFGDVGVTYNYGIGSGSGSPNSSQHSGGSGGVATAPVVPYTSINLTTSLSLNPAQETWINASNQFKIKKALQVYLFSNPFDDNAHTLAKQILIRMMNNPGVFKSIKPFLIEDNIDDSTLPPCPKAIVNKLKNLAQNDVARIIAGFDGGNSIYKLEIVNVSPTDPNSVASTNWKKDPQGNIIPYNYILKIRPELNLISTDLAISSTILHEIIHAYFLSMIDDCMQTGGCQSLQTFPDLWNFYVANQNGGVYTNNISQHNQIANSYVNIMAAALQEYITSIPVPNGQLPNQDYIDVAWYGLEGTIPYNNLSQVDKDRIKFRFENVELLNQSAVNANGQTITPIGSRVFPCN